MNWTDSLNLVTSFGSFENFAYVENEKYRNKEIWPLVVMKNRSYYAPPYTGGLYGDVYAIEPDPDYCVWEGCEPLPL